MLKIHKICKEVQELNYATPGSSGLDLSYPYPETIEIKPGERVVVQSGISIEIPNNYEAQVRSRSGLCMKHGIIVLNSPGTIDADYRGEIKVILYNSNNKPFKIMQHMRIAQLVIVPIVRLKIDHNARLNNTIRGNQGFGSTGLFSR